MTMMHNRATLIWIAAALLFAAPRAGAREAPPKDPDEWRPDAETIRCVDSVAVKLAIPNEFGTLSSYARYYWGTARDGHRLIEAVLIKPLWAKIIGIDASPTPHIVAEANAPLVADGGCSVFYLEFDVTVNNIVDSYCGHDLSLPAQHSNR